MERSTDLNNLLKQKFSLSRMVLVILTASALLLGMITAVSLPAEAASKNRAESGTTVTDIVLTVGETEAKRNLAWYSQEKGQHYVQVAQANGWKKGDPFPEAKQIVAQMGKKRAKGGQGKYNHFATIDGLVENTEYVYRVGNDAEWSDGYSFRTQAFKGDFNFLFFGDAQIGASKRIKPSNSSKRETSEERDRRDGEGWADTLGTALTKYPESELLFSAGDQVEVAHNKNQYKEFLAPDYLRSVPLIPVNGNHDVGSKAYEHHFNVPNWDPKSGKASSSGQSGGNYWFVYKEVLFVVLNSNSRDYKSHEKFMEMAVNEGKKHNVKWKILGFHHSIYSVAKHVDSGRVKGLRNKLPQVASRLGFDLALQGHDHSYTRSFLIRNGEKNVNRAEVNLKELTPKKGEVLYVTANSSSGSKYYYMKDKKRKDYWWAAKYVQEDVRNYTNVEVTDSDITITTWRSEDAPKYNKTQYEVVDEIKLKRAQ